MKSLLVTIQLLFYLKKKNDFQVGVCFSAVRSEGAGGKRGKKMKSAGHFGAGLDDLIYPKESVSLSSRRTVVPMDAPAEGGDVPYEICKKAEKWDDDWLGNYFITNQFLTNGLSVR